MKIVEEHLSDEKLDSKSLNERKVDALELAAVAPWLEGWENSSGDFVYFAQPEVAESYGLDNPVEEYEFPENVVFESPLKSRFADEEVSELSDLDKALFSMPRDIDSYVTESQVRGDIEEAVSRGLVEKIDVNYSSGHALSLYRAADERVERIYNELFE